MIKYWIVGVLDSPNEYHPDMALKGPDVTQYNVVWGGNAHRQMYAYTVRTSLGDHGPVRQVVDCPDSEGMQPFGYATRKNAREALAKMKAKGAGFTPLMHVHSLRVMSVGLGTNGAWYLIEGAE